MPQFLGLTREAHDGRGRSPSDPNVVEGLHTFGRGTDASSLTPEPDHSDQECLCREPGWRP